MTDHAARADEYERAALNFDAGYGPQSRVMFALLSIERRIAEMTQGSRTGMPAGLRSRIERAWSAETSADPQWHPNRPSLGQCAVTALVVQDALGGTLRRAIVNGVSHYWNALPDGSEVDLTRDQFDEPLTIDGTTERDREYVLSYPATAARYELLRARLARGDIAERESSE